jgi:hypothetical protein
MDLSSASELYILQRSRLPLVLTPDAAGTPTVIHPAPILYRAAYISSYEVDIGMQGARSGLTNDQCSLLAPVPCPDGPPFRSGLLFVKPQARNGVAWRDASTNYLGASMLHYAAATARADWNWLDDARAGRYGYFLTGTVGDNSLWRLFRLEVDTFNRSIFTLAPVRLASGCPQVDFSSLSDPLLKGEIDAQYVDMCRSVVTHSYRDVVTKARNITEGLISARLRVTGHSTGRDLFSDLQTIKRLIRQHRDTCGWTELEYHLAHRIRLVHARTHATATAKTGRPLKPEFALSVAEDLIELLTTWGYCQA